MKHKELSRPIHPFANELIAMLAITLGSIFWYFVFDIIFNTFNLHHLFLDFLASMYVSIGAVGRLSAWQKQNAKEWRAWKAARKSKEMSTLRKQTSQ